jgi:hypothetical protein
MAFTSALSLSARILGAASEQRPACHGGGDDFAAAAAGEEINLFKK